MVAWKTSIKVGDLRNWLSPWIVRPKPILDVTKKGAIISCQSPGDTELPSTNMMKLCKARWKKKKIQPKDLAPQLASRLLGSIWIINIWSLWFRFCTKMIYQGYAMKILRCQDLIVKQQLDYRTFFICYDHLPTSCNSEPFKENAC